MSPCVSEFWNLGSGTKLWLPSRTPGGQAKWQGSRWPTLFRRGPEAPQLPFVQAFPVFKVVVKVLH